MLRMIRSIKRIDKMKRKSHILPFDQDWLNRASSRKRGNKWVDDVMAEINESGGIYLSTLRLWFSQFPISAKQKRHLKQALESFNNTDHLGAVNELTWWKFTNSFGWSSSPIDSGKEKRPDFHVSSPSEFFCEVTTLNLSAKEQELLEAGNGVKLDHGVTLHRALKKVVEEKAGQIMYGALNKSPSVLVLFDYTFWSGFGTLFCKALADFLLGVGIGFMNLPPELAVIVYVERKVLEGRMAISRQRSAVYHNPNALFRLPETVFQMMRQYSLELKEELPTLNQANSEYWFFF